MSIEEAVKMLRTMQRTVYLGNRKFEDAIECAIKALSEPLQPWEVLVAQVVLSQPEIVRCKDCKYWHSGSCEYPEHVVNSQDYYVGDIETEAEHFCGYAERREVTT